MGSRSCCNAFFVGGYVAELCLVMVVSLEYVLSVAEITGAKLNLSLKVFLSESLLSTVISPPLSEREFRHEIHCIGVVLLSLFEFTIVYDVSIAAKLVIFCSLF